MTVTNAPEWTAPSLPNISWPSSTSPGAVATSTVVVGKVGVTPVGAAALQPPRARARKRRASRRRNLVHARGLLISPCAIFRPRRKGAIFRPPPDSLPAHRAAMGPSQVARRRSVGGSCNHARCVFASILNGPATSGRAEKLRSISGHVLTIELMRASANGRPMWKAPQRITATALTASVGGGGSRRIDLARLARPHSPPGPGRAAARGGQSQPRGYRAGSRCRSRASELRAPCWQAIRVASHQEPWTAPASTLVLYRGEEGWRYAVHNVLGVLDGALTRLPPDTPTDDAQTELLRKVELETGLVYSATWSSEAPGCWVAELATLDSPRPEQSGTA